jgi:hypothetical protein
MPTFNPGQILTAADLTGATGAWTSYTPTDSNITVGSGTRAAAYQMLTVKSCVFRWSFVLGAGSTFGANPSIGLPFAAAAARQVVSAVYGEVGVRYWGGFVEIASGASVGLLLHTESGGNGIVTTTAPFTWNGADADFIAVTGVLEIA